MATQQQAAEAVKRAGDLCERGVFPSDVYDGMRIAFTRGYYAIVASAFEQTCKRLAEQHGPYLTHLSDQLAAHWRDMEPSIRAWVAQADTLTASQWMDEADETRERYEALKALLAGIDSGK